MKAATTLRRLAILAASVLLTQCATTTPPARFTQPLTDIITAEDSVQTTVADSSGGMTLTDRLRLGAKVTTQVRTLALSNGGKSERYQLVVDVTRYDHGNAAVRAFIPGGGQIHLDGYVSVYKLPGRTLVGQFSISKTFAWTGMYALVTRMNTIENTFARAVAETATGRK